MIPSTFNSRTQWWHGVCEREDELGANFTCLLLHGQLRLQRGARKPFSLLIRLIPPGLRVSNENTLRRSNTSVIHMFPCNLGICCTLSVLIFYCHTILHLPLANKVRNLSIPMSISHAMLSMPSDKETETRCGPAGGGPL
jgi:hypothetical protein